MKKQNTSPRDEAKKATAEDDEVDLSDSEYEEYSEYVTDSQVRFAAFVCTFWRSEKFIQTEVDNN